MLTNEKLKVEFTLNDGGIENTHMSVDGMTIVMDEEQAVRLANVILNNYYGN